MDVPTHIQHFAGLTFKFGGKDTDGDGIYDKMTHVQKKLVYQNSMDVQIMIKTESKIQKMLVQMRAGTKELNGCPDNDGDGNHQF